MIEVKPLYTDRKYFCPICDYELKFNTKFHKKCDVKFDWNGIKPVYAIKRVSDILNYKPLKSRAIALKTHYSDHYIENMLKGECGLNDDIRAYLIDEIEIYVRKLRVLKNELKGELNGR